MIKIEFIFDLLKPKIMVEEKVRVIQYNLLSQKLCSPDWFSECLPENCDPEARWQRIKNKLLGEIQKGSIFCLQEVSQTWASRLTVLFSNHGYHFIFRLSGSNFSDYMGSGIAFPLNKYKLKDCRFVRVGDLIPVPNDSTKIEEDWSTWLVNNSNYWSNRLFSWPKKAEDHWASSRNKWNVMIMVTLNGDQSEFVIANYHMPCDFRRSTVMTLHSYYAMAEAQKFANDTMLIFSGDFNFKPDSKQYQMITRGKKILAEDFQNNSKTAVKDWFDPEFKPMMSVYQLINQREPLFTNYAKTARSEEAFKATLDYIFIFPKLLVSQAIKLPQEKPEDIYSTPLPNEEEPSDHLMLGAEIVVF